MRWLIVDARAITGIGYSGARVVGGLLADLRTGGVTVILVHVAPSLLHDLVRHHLRDLIGPDHIVEKLHDAIAHIRAAH